VTTNAGETELPGASFLPNLYGQATNIASGPAFVSTDSSQALVFATDGNNDYAIEVQETRRQHDEPRPRVLHERGAQGVSAASWRLEWCRSSWVGRDDGLCS
jgi:hypothetical protein